MPAFLLTHTKTLSACSPGLLRTLLIDATWLLCHRQHAAGTACWLFSPTGCGDRHRWRDPVFSWAVNLHYLGAEQGGLNRHKEVLFHPIQFLFHQPGKKCTFPSWSFALIISFRQCLASVLSREQETLVQADIVLRRQPLALDGKDILKTNGEFCFIK